MATRIDDILVRVRDTLSDEDGTRWPDPRLLRLLDEGQKEIVKAAKLLRTKVLIPVVVDTAEYTLPTDCYKVIRILYKGSVIPLTSHEELDMLENKDVIGLGWESSTGEPQKIVFDKMNTKRFKAFPIPDEATNAELVNATQTPENTGDPVYGMTADITDYEVDNVYGLVVDFSKDMINVYSNQNTSDATVYGVLTYFDDEAEHFTVYYLKKPTDITATTDELEVDEEYDVALKYFITGMALRDDKDTQSVQQAKDELNFFGLNVRAAMKNSSHDFTAVRTNFDSPYISGFQ